jgi:hypothetical protein
MPPTRLRASGNEDDLARDMSCFEFGVRGANGNERIGALDRTTTSPAAMASASSARVAADAAAAPPSPLTPDFAIAGKLTVVSIRSFAMASSSASVT